MRTHVEVAKLIEATDVKLKRWRSRVKRGMTAINALEQRRRRLEKLLTKPATISRIELPKATIGTTVEVTGPAIVSPPTDDQLEIPPYLRRRIAPNAEPEAVKELVERGKAKSKGQAEARKARRSGETRKMPLTGKDAAKFIASGE